MRMSVNCSSENGGEKQIDLYIGDFKGTNFPISFQIKWLEEKGLKVPDCVVQSMKEIQEVAKKNSVDFLELLDFVINSNSQHSKESGTDSSNNDEEETN